MVKQIQAGSPGSIINVESQPFNNEMLNANSSREKQNEDQKAVDSVSGGARSQRAAGAGDREGRHPAEDMLDGLGTKIGDRRKTLPSTQNARNDAEQV